MTTLLNVCAAPRLAVRGGTRSIQAVKEHLLQTTIRPKTLQALHDGARDGGSTAAAVFLEPPAASERSLRFKLNRAGAPSWQSVS